MHPYVLIPLLACVAAGVLASAIVARDSAARTHWLSASLLGCGAVWALFDVLWTMAPDAGTALLFMRLAGLAYLPMAPLALQLLVTLRPELRPRVPLATAYAVSSALIVAHAATPWFVSNAIAVRWGWAYEFGPAIPLAFGHVALCIGATWVGIAGGRDVPRAASVLRGRGPRVAIALPLGAVVVSDVLLPLLGIHGPRLGALSLSLVAAGVWLFSRREDRSPFAPRAFARHILDILPDGVALLREDGTIRAANRSLAELVGMGREDLIGRPLASILEESAEHLSRTASGREAVMRLADGGTIPVSVSSSLLHDWQGGRIGTVLAIRDQREVVDLRRQLVESGRLAAVGELAAGIAHEVNNPIAFIQANLNALARHYDVLAEDLAKDDIVPDLAIPLEEGRHLIEQSLGGVRRVATVVRDVRGFSHAGLGELLPCDLNELLENALRLALLQLGTWATVERCYGEIPALPVAGQELKQVFLTLILNAAEAIDESGAIRLATACCDDTVVVSVADDGCGMPARQLETIFEPGAAEGAHREGLGLHLSACHEIVRRHGGEIAVESHPGVGTRVEVRLPISGGGV